MFSKTEFDLVKKILNFDYPEASRRGIRQNFSDLKDRKPNFLKFGVFFQKHLFIDPEAEPRRIHRLKKD